jgi:uncharacterized membrane protein
LAEIPPYRGDDRPGLAEAAVGLVLLALLVAYPFAFAWIHERLGTRGVAGLLLCAVAASLPGGRRAPGGRWTALGLAGAGGAALATGDARYLRLVPAGIYAGLAVLFAASLRGPDSIVQQGARWLVPQAPDFIRDYCRAITGVWVAFFLASSAAIAWLALAGSEAGWRAATGGWVWVAAAAISAVEFLVRKSWFRYYPNGGPFERLWSRLFPSERTERGRRSMAYLRAERERLAREADAAQGP